MILALGLLGRNGSENTISDGSVVSVEEEMPEEKKETETSVSIDDTDPIQDIGKIKTIEMSSSPENGMQMVSLAQKESYYTEDGSLWYWREFEYDGDGNEIKVVHYEDGAMTGWVESEYDESGNKIKQTEYESDGSTSLQEEFEYDRNGNEIKHTYYEDGSICSWNESEYDNHGNEIKRVYYGEDGISMHWEEYEYAGNIKKILSYYDDGRIEVSREETEYDGDGNLIKVTKEMHSAEGSNIRNSYEYEYAYDTEGYLVKKIEHGKGEVNGRTTEGTTVTEYSVMQVSIRK